MFTRRCVEKKNRLGKRPRGGFLVWFSGSVNFSESIQEGMRFFFFLGFESIL